jgi:hypothetical protein
VTKGLNRAGQCAESVWYSLLDIKIEVDTDFSTEETDARAGVHFGESINRVDARSKPHGMSDSVNVFGVMALIIVSAIVKELRFPQKPLRTLRLCAFARNQTAWTNFSQRRKGAKFAKILLGVAQFLSGGRNDDHGRGN